MSDSLTEEELAELVRHGRLSTSKSAMQHQKRMKTREKRNERPAAPRREGPTLEAKLSKLDTKLDPGWLKAQKEKAETNIAAQRLDKRRKEEMQEASKF